jgi:hypothetical protein
LALSKKSQSKNKKFEKLLTNKPRDVIINTTKGNERKIK